MRKIIALILVSAGLLLAVGELYNIDNNTRILGWVSIKGDVYPVVTNKYDLGKAANQWDSAWVRFPKFQSMFAETCSVGVYIGTIDSATWAKKADSLKNKGTYVSGQYFLRDNVQDTFTDLSGDSLKLRRLYVTGTDQYLVRITGADDGFVVTGETTAVAINSWFRSLEVIASQSGWAYAVGGEANNGKVAGYFASAGTPLVAVINNYWTAQDDTLAIFGTATSDYTEIFTRKSWIDSTGKYQVAGGSSIDDDVRVKDSTFTDFLAGDDSSRVRLDTLYGKHVNMDKAVLDTISGGVYFTDSAFISTIRAYTGGKIRLGTRWWFQNDTSFCSDGGADTSSTVQDGTNLKINSDNDVYVNTNLTVNGAVKSTGESNVLVVDYGCTGVATIATSTNLYYISAATNEDFLGTLWRYVPKKILGANIVLDTITINYSTAATTDSVKIVFKKLFNGAYTKIDSLNWVTGATGWVKSGNILANGDYTLLDNTCYAMDVNCKNQSAANIMVETFLRIVYH